MVSARWMHEGLHKHFENARISKQGDLHLRIGNNMSFERVETFCYFGGILSSDGGCDRAVLEWIYKAGNEFRTEVIFVCQEIV